MKTYTCFYLDWADKEIALDRLSVRGRPSICSNIEQYAVTIAYQKSCFSFLTKQSPMRVNLSNAATKRGNWHILRQVYISGWIYAVSMERSVESLI